MFLPRSKKKWPGVDGNDVTAASVGYAETVTGAEGLCCVVDDVIGIANVSMHWIQLECDKEGGGGLLECFAVSAWHEAKHPSV